MATVDAIQILRTTLERYGLGSLTDRVWQLYSDGTLPATSDIDTIGTALADTPEFQARFPANAQRRAKGLPELTVSEYIGLERGYRNAMQGSGLPSGFYDQPSDFSNLIGADVSVAEVQDRVNKGFEAVAQTNPEVVRQMKELYGVDEGGLAAYFLDPAMATPILTRQARSAQIAAEATRMGVGQITAQQAEVLARENIGAQEAQAGFRQVAAQQELAAPLLGEQGQISQAEQIGAVFGTSEAARQRVETRRRRRVAAFAEGGGFATGQQGIAGLGTGQ